MPGCAESARGKAGETGWRFFSARSPAALRPAPPAPPLLLTATGRSRHGTGVRGWVEPRIFPARSPRALPNPERTVTDRHLAGGGGGFDPALIYGGYFETVPLNIFPPH